MLAMQSFLHNAFRSIARAPVLSVQVNSATAHPANRLDARCVLHTWLATGDETFISFHPAGCASSHILACAQFLIAGVSRWGVAPSSLCSLSPVVVAMMRLLRQFAFSVKKGALPAVF
ncbi:MAG TPA: hypothetical protein VLH85_01705 [Levilinea sp.]|nr:hypothetical protein [Levilinea sp.]